MSKFIFILGMLVVVALGGCGGGGGTKTVTETTTNPADAATAAARSQNNAVIQQASQAPDNQAQLGETKIKAILAKKIGLDNALDFNLNGHIDPNAGGGDCYIKLGAEAVNFENQTENILHSPNGQDLVFVQSDTTTPLVKCLTIVRNALGW